MLIHAALCNRRNELTQWFLGYEPSTPLAVVATVIFALVGIGLLGRIVLRWRHGDLRWGWCILIGAFGMTVLASFAQHVR